MPLTKPECLDYQYNLRGTRFGTPCPECGGVERKLLLTGASPVLTWAIVIGGLVLTAGALVMLLRILFSHLPPTTPSDWFADAFESVRVVLVTALIATTALCWTLAYGVLVVSYLNHSILRIKLWQMLCSGLIGLMSLLAAGTL